MKKVLLFFAAITPLISQGQLLNAGFENWDAGDVWPLASDWESGYSFQETDAYEGNYALTISAWYAYLKTKAIQQAAINERPLFFNGYFKYTENTVRNINTQTDEPDIAIVSVFLTKWNTMTAQRDTIGSGNISLNGANVYTPFSCPITYLNDAIPDTVEVIFDPSKVRRFLPDYYRAYNFTECSFFTIDALSFSNATLSSTNSVKNQIAIFPNPASELITIHDSGNEVSGFAIYDMAGKMIYKGDITENAKVLSVKTFSDGLYALMLYNKQEILISTQRFIKK